MSSETPEENTSQPTPEEVAPESAPVEEPTSEVVEPTSEVEASGEESVSEPVAAPTAAADDSSVAGLTLGQGSPADESLSDAPAPIVRGKMDRFGVAMGTGRRKTSVARVRIKDGDGKFVVNGRPIDEYFAVERDRLMIMAVLESVDVKGKVDVWVRATGGGTTGQTGAVILGIARALQARDESLHHSLSANGYLTRDGRMVERKKYGLRKARRSFQFSKR